MIHYRENWLTSEDFAKAKNTLQKGDVVLVGSLRRASHLFINAPLTHTMYYTGNHEFIHAIGDGVEEATLEDVFTEYDTMLILRLKSKHQRAIPQMLKYIKQQVGKPYDFDFAYKNDDSFYCSALIHRALEEAGLDPRHFEKKNKKARLRPNTIHPMNFIGTEFKTIFKSHNLAKENNKIVLIPGYKESRLARLIPAAQTIFNR